MSPANCIYPQQPCRIFAQCGRFEMDNLPGAVNAGIGVPGAEHVNRFICHLRALFPVFPARRALHS